MKKKIKVFVICLILFSRASAVELSVTDFGAIPDSVTLNTKAIQATIDRCHKLGGGIVFVPAGVYLTGSLFLKDNVTVELQRGAELRGSGNIADYPEIKSFRALVYAYKTKNASLQGDGIINGQGGLFPVGDNAPNRPYVVMIDSCTQIRISNLKLINSAKWTLRLLGGSDIYVTGIQIYSHTNYNNDGIDIDSKNVRISDCYIDTDDDALCFKSDLNVPCENVVVTNCILASNCNLIKMGTASFGGFKNITIQNCVLKRASESNFRNWNKRITGVTEPITGIAGIALEIVDGGHLDQVNISNIVMDGVHTPIFMRLGSRSNPTGSMRNVLISNIIATNTSLIPNTISGVPGFDIENVSIRNFSFNSMGKGQHVSYKTEIPEAESQYPENRMFGDSLPAFGFYIRHAKDITLSDIKFNLLNADSRPAIWVEKSASVEMQNISVKGIATNDKMFYFRDKNTKKVKQ